MLNFHIVFNFCANRDSSLGFGGYFWNLKNRQVSISSESFLNAVSSYHSCVELGILYFPSHYKACAFGRHAENIVLGEYVQYILDKVYKIKVMTRAKWVEQLTFLKYVNHRVLEKFEYLFLSPVVFLQLQLYVLFSLFTIVLDRLMF